MHDDACQRDKAGNRQLHFDQYSMLVLLFLFNPIVSSLRAIVQASQLRKVQRRLGCQRTSLGSLSEAASVFDAGRRKGIVRDVTTTGGGNAHEGYGSRTVDRVYVWGCGKARR